MTREEAIDVVGEYRNVISKMENTEYTVEALDAALTALRGPTREMVERMRGEWNYSHTTEIDRFAVIKCSKCGHEAFAMALYVKDGNFCPSCGAPITDEAVDIELRRWKEAVDNEA